MIKLRELEDKDAEYMLEWMHDVEIQRSFKKDMINMTREDVLEFIAHSKVPTKLFDNANVHFAIVNNQDEYLGTISLKNIELINRSAEYAIATRKKAHGRGIAYRATGLLLKKAFGDYGLHRVYLNVLENNQSAIRLYERSGFILEGEFRECLDIKGKYMNLKWYSMLENEFDAEKFY